MAGVTGDATMLNLEGEHCRSNDLVVDAVDRKVVAVLTNWVIPISAFEGHPNHCEVTTLANHGEVTTLAIHAD